MKEYITSDGTKFKCEYSYKEHQNVLNTKSALEKIRTSKNIIYHNNLEHLTPPFFPDSYLDIDEYISIAYCYYFTPVNKDGIKEANSFLEAIVDSNNTYLNTDYDCQDLTEKDINETIIASFDEDLKFIEARKIISFKKEFQCFFDVLTNEINQRRG